jgi:hypothetical protein
MKTRPNIHKVLGLKETLRVYWFRKQAICTVRVFTLIYQ